MCCMPRHLRPLADASHLHWSLRNKCTRGLGTAEVLVQAIRVVSAAMLLGSSRIRSFAANAHVQVQIDGGIA